MCLRIKAPPCLSSTHSLPELSLKICLNCAYFPSLANRLSRSAIYGREPQKPCISLNTFKNTRTIASGRVLEFESLFESILKRITSVGTLPASFMSAIIIGSAIFLPSVKYSIAFLPFTSLFCKR